MISDVPGDDVGAIASGPTVPDPTTQAEARHILEKYRYPSARPSLHRSWATRSGRRRSPAIQSSRNDTRAPDRDGRDGACGGGANSLEQKGYRVVQLGDDLDDEAQALGREHARLAKDDAHVGPAHGDPVRRRDARRAR